MPNQGDAEILQILGRQGRQHPRVDLVRAERRLVLLQPELPQPLRDIHRRHPPVMRTAVVSYAFTRMATGERPAPANPRRPPAVSSPTFPPMLPG